MLENNAKRNRTSKWTRKNKIKRRKIYRYLNSPWKAEEEKKLPSLKNKRIRIYFLPSDLHVEFESSQMMIQFAPACCGLPCFISPEFKVFLDNYMSDQISKFPRSDQFHLWKKYPVYPVPFLQNCLTFQFSRRILVFFVYFLTIFRERGPQIWLVYSVIRLQLTEWLIRLRNQLNWELLSAGPHSTHNVLDSFLKNYSYFYTKVIYR